MTKEFVSGTTYAYRLICDYDLRITFEVVKRTKCYLTIKDSEGERKVKVYQRESGVEYIYPTGQYSMAPSCDATEIG